MKSQITILIFHSISLTLLIYLSAHHSSIKAMPITNHKCRIGGKMCKQQLRRVPTTPYNRPPTAARRMCLPPQANEVGGGCWLAKLVDSASRVIFRSASRFFSTVFGKGIAAPSGENIVKIEEVPTTKSSFEEKEQGKSSIDLILSIHYDGSEASKQEIISQIDALFQIHEECTNDSHVEIARACPRSKPQNATPTISKDSKNNYMTPKPQDRLPLYKSTQSPYFGSYKPMKYNPSKESIIEASKTIKLITSPSNSMNFGQRQALKRGISDIDVECADAARRVRQKSCPKDLDLFTNIRQKQKQIIDLGRPNNRDLKTHLCSVPFCSLCSPSLVYGQSRKKLYELDKY